MWSVQAVETTHAMVENVATFASKHINTMRFYLVNPFMPERLSTRSELA